MDRRTFLSTSGTALAAGALLTEVPPLSAASTGAQNTISTRDTNYDQRQQFRISYSTFTNGGWEGDPFAGFSEARDVGFRYVENFGEYFCAVPEKYGTNSLRGPAESEDRKVWPGGYAYIPRKQPPREVYYPDRWEELQHRIYEIGVQFTSITGGEPDKSTAFQNPTQRTEVVDNHFNMARFSHRFGCDHFKTNPGKRASETIITSTNSKGTSLEDIRNIASTFSFLGKRLKEELGMHLGIHAHLFSQIQTQQEIDYVMENTNSDHVGLVIDTAHVTLAGMDPLALARKYGKRVVEYHLKDTAPETRGGAKTPTLPGVNQMIEPYFFPLGTGGVDFPGLLSFLKSIGWRGHLNVELDTSPRRPAKDSAQISFSYIRDVLKLQF